MPSVLCVVLLAALFERGTSQIPLPKRPLGFVYDAGSSNAQIHLEAFVDLLCPDAQQAWPTVKKVADLYGPHTLMLNVHLFPLPYHTNAFLAAQDKLYNFIIMAKNRYDVMNIIVELGRNIGIPAPVMKSGLTNPHYNENTRISWKYGCSRTVSGTPFFFVNGIFVNEALSSWSLGDWKKLIDPLIL